MSRLGLDASKPAVWSSLRLLFCRSFEGEVFVSRGQLPASTGAGSLAAGAVAGHLVPVAVTGICTMSDRLYDGSMD